MFGIWILAVFLLGTATGKEVCYDRVGCFTDDVPWSGTLERPIHKLPWSPETISTRFLLYTKQNSDNYQDISATNPTTIRQSNFDVNKKTRFIVHGFIDKGEENWLSDLCRVLEDVNCICVDWKKGSRCQYTQASNNIRVVGAEIAYFVNVLMEQFGYSASNVHIIGHSLGAHVAGEAGKRRPGIGRITGLDPAQPYFQDTPIEVRLDQSDAEFVDVIHTDTAPTIPYLGFGMSTAIGHLDFYPNGGREMPGCELTWEHLFTGTRDFVACNHLRSYKYYSDSIIYPNGFLGFACASYDTFKTESCFPCPKGGCPNMGHYADKFKGKVGNGITKLYLNTAEHKNFPRKSCIFPLLITNIELYQHASYLSPFHFQRGSLKPGSTYTNLVDAEHNVGAITKVKFLWNNNWVNPAFPKIGAAKVTVQFGETGEQFNFCGSETVREDILQTLTAC
uniref:Triacylglycerol lipase n=1 Tax=Nothoprocta perdicaria TaxID=30464 RepID=A0A8C6ZVV5_NOTPE